jgi:hypothetical protein
MRALKEILSTRDPKKGKYSKHEHQVYGYYLATILDDLAHTALYIKLAKEVSRDLLEKALAFVKDSKARSRGRLFMWKLKELRNAAKTSS